MKKVYLAGQSNEHDNDWKEIFKKISCFEYHNWEIHSDQTSPETYFPDDLKGIYSSDILVANPGIAPSEATWIEIGLFYAKNIENLGERCNKLIIIWKDERNPKWSIEFVKKTGIVVSTFEEAIAELEKLK